MHVQNESWLCVLAIFNNKYILYIVPSVIGTYTSLNTTTTHALVSDIIIILNAADYKCIFYNN